MPTLLAYHNDAKIKSKFVRRMEGHRKADELVQRCTWESNGVTRGCAVGCCFHKYDHSRGPIEIGVPEILIHLNDAIFEGLPKKDAVQWPTRFLKAIPVGADLSLVAARFAIWNLTDEKWGAIALPNQEPEALACCRRVAALWQRVIDGEALEPLRAEFSKEEAFALAGALAGAGAWAWAWARALARALARAGALARALARARAGAWARAGAGAGAGARAGAKYDEYIRAMADKFIELIKKS